jgi:hypothetical protein
MESYLRHFVGDSYDVATSFVFQIIPGTSGECVTNLLTLIYSGKAKVSSLDALTDLLGLTTTLKMEMPRWTLLSMAVMAIKAHSVRIGFINLGVDIMKQFRSGWYRLRLPPRRLELWVVRSNPARL